MNIKHKKIILNTDNGNYVEYIEFFQEGYNAKETWNREWARLFDGDKARTFVKKLNKQSKHEYKAIPAIGD